MSGTSRVLLIDNDADVSGVVASFLSRRGGFEVLNALDGRAGLDLLAAEREAGRAIDLIVLDLRMPGMGGTEVLSELEELSAAPAVIVLSGYVDDDDRARLEGSSLVHAIVGKPFDLFGLVATAEAAIAGSGESSAAADGAGPELPFQPLATEPPE